MFHWSSGPVDSVANGLVALTTLAETPILIDLAVVK